MAGATALTYCGDKSSGHNRPVDKQCHNASGPYPHSRGIHTSYELSHEPEGAQFQSKEDCLSLKAPHP